MNEILSMYLKVQLLEATRQDHQSKDPARGAASAADRSRWQLAVHWFKSIAEQNISWQVTRTNTTALTALGRVLRTRLCY